MEILHSELTAMSSSNIEDVLQSLKEVVISQQVGTTHEPTPTELFALILASLCSGHEQPHTLQLLEIFYATIPSTAPVVVRSQYKQVLFGLLGLCKANTENSKLIRLSLASLGRCMKMQETSEAFWRSKEAMHGINAMLRMIDDPKVKLRKAVQQELIALMVVHKKSNATFVRNYIADFAVEVMKSCSKSDYKRALHVVIFLEQAAQYFVEKDAVKVCEFCLRLQECHQAVLSVEVFRMLDSFFQSPALSLSGAQTLECIRLLYSYQPATADMETNTYFCGVVASSLVCLHKLDRNLSNSAFTHGVSLLLSKCEKDFTEIHVAVGNAIKRIVTSCVDSQIVLLH